MESICANIKATGIQIESVTCDGAANILRAVREVCPEAILQRCMVHVALEIKTWLTLKPQTTAARELLELVGLLAPVQTPHEAQLWIRAFIDWHRKYEEFINEKSMDEESGKWWYTYKMLHRSASHIKRAIPKMFNYTRNDKIPKSSNSIESFFGHLKDNLRIHRRLSKDHFKDFIKWHLFFRSNVDRIKKKWISVKHWWIRLLKCGSCHSRASVGKQALHVPPAPGMARAADPNGSIRASKVGVVRFSPSEIYIEPLFGQIPKTALGIKKH